MVDWAGLAADKYANEAKNAESRRIEAEASANYQNTKAKLAGTETDAQVALQRAQAGHLQAQTGMLPQQMLEESQTGSVNRDRARAEIEGLNIANAPGSFDLAARVANQTFGFGYGTPPGQLPSPAAPSGGAGIRYGKSSGFTMSPGFSTPSLAPKTPVQTIGEPDPLRKGFP